MGGRLRDDRGESLIELLVTVVIMGFTMVAVVGGLLTAVQMSDVHRKQTNAGVVAQRLAEGVAQAAYVNCAAGYPTAGVPSGYTATVGVRYWDAAWNAGSTASPWKTACPSPDQGVQQVTVRVASGDGRATEQAVVVVRRP
jgi:type II secretory pathway pseudopilin PulG